MNNETASIIKQNIGFLQEITAPYAAGAEHVQGGGGNTSVKDDSGNMLIKASGYLFSNISNENQGVVLVETKGVIEGIHNKISGVTDYETIVPMKGAFPDNGHSKPSMEYEFHALLGKYVLHTHSVYANVINCCSDADAMYQKALSGLNYLIIPYVTPGFPIAAHLVNYLKKNRKIPEIILLKNHGVIVHGATAAGVNSTYEDVQNRLQSTYAMEKLNELKAQECPEGFELPASSLYGTFDINTAQKELEGDVLFPDQTIFFKGKISQNKEDNTPLYLNIPEQKIEINGSRKFAEACVEMIQAVRYVNEQQKRLGLHPVWLSNNDVDILHGLSAEKHRIAILNK